MVGAMPRICRIISGPVGLAGLCIWASIGLVSAKAGAAIPSLQHKPSSAPIAGYRAGARQSATTLPEDSNAPRWPTTAPQRPGDAEATTQPDVAEAQRERQLQVFGPILLNPSPDIDPQTRRNAAQELFAMGAPDAADLLIEALGSGKATVMQAVLDVLRTAPVDSLAPFEQSCMAAIAAPPPESLEALCIVLARLGGRTCVRLAALALDAQAPIAQRLGPIAALGFFHDRSAAGHLMVLIDRATQSIGEASAAQPPEITNAACASLKRLTGMPLGPDAEQWRRWWTDAQHLPPEQWFRAMAESLGDRVTELEGQLRKTARAREALSKQVFDTYRELYPALPVEEQVRRLPRLLDDPSPPVRMFALSRVSLLLRDSVRIGSELQKKLAERTNDEVPELRAETFAVLDELNYEGLSALVATRLEAEQAPIVVGALLKIIAKHPDDSMLAASRQWLGTREVRDQAARAVWAILTTGTIDDAELANTRAAVLHEVDHPPPAIELRVLAFISDAADAAMLEEALDGEDAARKAAVAEGLAARGLRQLLIDRAGDPVIYPFVLRAAAREPADMTTLRALVSLQPPDEHRALWVQAVQDLAGTLPAALILQIDDVLAETSWSDPSLRKAVLMHNSSDEPAALAAAQQPEFWRRLALVMIDLGEVQQAFETLQAVTTPAASDQLQDVRFKAAALSGHYEEAATLSQDAAAWISLLEHANQRNPDLAATLRDEILRRFGDELTAVQRVELDRLGRGLGNNSTAAARDTRSGAGPR
jgi:hypothetical protein